MNTLLELLERETSAIRSFIALLEREHTLLIAGDAENLLTLAEEKSSFAARLSDLDKQRDHAFHQLKVSTAPAAIAHWLSAQDDALKAAWQTLIALAREVQKQNALNGKLINARMQHNRQALNILLNAGEAVDTYGPDGQQRNGNGGRSLGSA